MVYYKIPTTNGFVYPRGCILRRAYPYSGYMYCEFESVTSVDSSWVVLSQTNFLENCPNVENNPPDYIESVTATKAVLTSGNIVLTLPRTVQTGTVVKFKAPCNCSSFTGNLWINNESYLIVDSLKRTLNGNNRIWDSDSLISVIVDVEQHYAFIQNANYFKESGGTFTGSVIATPTNQNRQVRNVTISKNEPSGGVDGDIWYVYSE